MKFCLGLCFFLAVGVSSAMGTVGVRQTAIAGNPDQSCVDVPFGWACTPVVETVTVSFASSIAGTTIGVIGDFGFPCIDNLGQHWESLAGIPFLALTPPSNGQTVGITSLTCSVTSDIYHSGTLYFFEIFGNNPKSIRIEEDPHPCGRVHAGKLGLFFVGVLQDISRATADPPEFSPAVINTDLNLASAAAFKNHFEVIGANNYSRQRTDVQILYGIAGKQDLLPSVSTTTSGAFGCIEIEFQDDHGDDEADLGCDCEDKANVAQPINVKSGNTYVHEQDFAIPGLNGGLHLTRTWNSLWRSMQPGAPKGFFGDSWRSNLEERLVIGNGAAKYWRGDGSTWTFVFDSSQSAYKLQQPGNERAVLQVDSNSSRAVLTFRDGKKKLFSLNGAGRLVADIDRNGNTTSLSYDASDRLITVADPAGRKLYFNYTDSRSPLLVTNVTSDAGKSVSYNYDSNGRLIQVKYPDASTLNFQYDQNALLIAVTDSAGKVLETHTYDNQRRGLTSSRANGVDAVTVSYPN